MKTHLILAFISVLSVSCSKQWCSSHYPPISSKDSIYIENIKEIPVYLPGDTINIDVPINCPDQDVAIFENTQLRQQIRILNRRLVSNTQIKPDTVKVYVTETKTVVNTVKVPEPVKYIPRIYKQSLSICVFIFICAFLFIGWKAYKFFKK